MEEIEVDLHECRACLQKFAMNMGLLDLFKPWPTVWAGMANTIAEDLNKITNIQIFNSDLYPKNICKMCTMKLRNACYFVDMVIKSDATLKERYIKKENEWPEPIQINRLNESYSNNLADNIKQEVLSDDENQAQMCDEFNTNSVSSQDPISLDIKIEPEEIMEQHHSNASNGCILPDDSYNNIYGRIEDLVNGSPVITKQKMFNNTNTAKIKDLMQANKIKEEPVSDNDEMFPSDLPLECMLCAKNLKTLSGLKAHVIAQHSYKSVKRKDLTTSHIPEEKKENPTKKHTCVMCPKSFPTLTDLMTHDISHNKHKCYGCKKAFDTSSLLTKHRTRCKSVMNRKLSKIKIRLRAKSQKNKPVDYECQICKITFADEYFLLIHMEAAHS